MTDQRTTTAEREPALVTEDALDAHANESTAASDANAGGERDANAAGEGGATAGTAAGAPVAGIDAGTAGSMGEAASRTEAAATAAGAATAANTSGADDGGNAALFDAASSQQLRERWVDIQGRFVDEPRGAVQQADALVQEVMQHLSEGFAREKRDLEARWSGGDQTSTEDLRLAIRRYRSFFNRLLSL